MFYQFPTDNKAIPLSWVMWPLLLWLLNTSHRGSFRWYGVVRRYILSDLWYKTHQIPKCSSSRLVVFCPIHWSQALGREWRYTHTHTPPPPPPSHHHRHHFDNIAYSYSWRSSFYFQPWIQILHKLLHFITLMSLPVIDAASTLFLSEFSHVCKIYDPVTRWVKSSQHIWNIWNVV